MDFTNINQLCIDTIRTLSIDAIEAAKSGHPGAPMGCAPMAYTLWNKFLSHNPADPEWINRDRFILSNGHASALLYSILHLSGYAISLEDIKNFRQWESKTPGHPEYNLSCGIEMTTGPLGQGFAHGIGMAIAERWMAHRYNQPNFNIINHNTYAIVSDGDLQEGVASEAASIAGTLQLGKVIYLYDDNDISIEGNTDITFVEDVKKRFESYGWQVVGPIDGMDTEDLSAAIDIAKQEETRPSLIICRTTIGYGSPNKANTSGVHGEPLGPEETLLTKAQLGWKYDKPFSIPPEVESHFNCLRNKSAESQNAWSQLFAEYERNYPLQAKNFKLEISGELPVGWDEGLDDLFKDSSITMSTRDAGGRVMNAISEEVPILLGGSADLAPSTKTILNNKSDFSATNYSGNNFHFGVREHAMGALANGMALHGGTIPYTATFLLFSDYMRPPMRLAAMMGLRVIYIFTHDSIGLGQDGPTHQPIEQLLSLRAIPNMVVLRPADATETAEAWKIAVSRMNGPTVIVLSRQNLPILDRHKFKPSAGVHKGAYILHDSLQPAQAIILSTGSEIELALEAAKLLESEEIHVRIVSMTSWELFDQQPLMYQHEVLPPHIRSRVSVEAATELGWERYTTSDGTNIGISRFGASAPSDVIYSNLGLTAEKIVDEVKKLIA
ncbi:MAG: transketolase [Dehalococcoidia bacterium]|nr:transketolase [Dehalococcoidia bacterium]|tara:strand:+ start:1974 stop:3980 length:2007 start_codon:yes stop_codon:yes gene_type:complete